MRKLMLILVPFLVSSGLGFAQEMRPPVNASDIERGAARNVFPAGAQIAVIPWHPFKSLHVVRLKFPADYKLPVKGGGFYR